MAPPTPLGLLGCSPHVGRHPVHHHWVDEVALSAPGRAQVGALSLGVLKRGPAGIQAGSRQLSWAASFILRRLAPAMVLSLLQSQALLAMPASIN